MDEEIALGGARRDGLETGDWMKAVSSLCFWSSRRCCEGLEEESVERGDDKADEVFFFLASLAAARLTRLASWASRSGEGKDGKVW